MCASTRSRSTASSPRSSTRSSGRPDVRAYLLSRLAQTVLVVFLSLTAVFFLVRLGGDPVLLFLPMDIQAKDLNEFRQRLGFNDPLRRPVRPLHGGARSAATSASRCATSRTPSASSWSGCPRPSAAGGSPRSLLTFLRRHPGRRDLGDRAAARVFDFLGMGGAVLGPGRPRLLARPHADLPLLGAARLAPHRRAPAASRHFVMPCVRARLRSTPRAWRGSPAPPCSTRSTRTSCSPRAPRASPSGS